MNPAAVAILEQLRVLTREASEALAAFREPIIRNHRKEVVGRIYPVFSLND
jgi:hypothetical protein